MKKKISIILAVLFIFCNYIVMTSKNVYAVEKKIILIDAGHGGIDGGAVGQDGTVEKEINLIISQKLKDSLKKSGYEVIMVREEDKGLYTEDGTVRKKKLEDLYNRNSLIKDSNCHMFISIHLNIFPEKQYYGAQVWHADNNPSREFATLLQKTLVEDLNYGNKRKTKCAKQDYIILRDCPDIPAVIVECGFLSNPDELLRLKDDKYQEKIASTIKKSVELYFTQ